MKSKVLLPPPGKFDELDIYSRKRWRQVQGLANTFWLRWKNQYLQTLQPKQKWVNTMPSVAVGDIVIVREDNSCRNNWPLARVVETVNSSDDKIRKVKIVLANRNLNKDGKPKTSPVILERPIHNMVVIQKSTTESSM
jgi:hypothetical protein